MATPKSYHVDHTKKIGDVISISIILVAASGFAITTPVFLSESRAFAATLLPPRWILNALNDQNRSALTQSDLAKIKQLANGSYKTLAALLQRLNAVANQLKLSFQFQMGSVTNVDPITGKKIEPSYGDTVTLTIQVVNGAGKVIATYVIGSGIFDVGNPPNPILAQTSALQVLAHSINLRRYGGMAGLQYSQEITMEDHQPCGRVDLIL
jgi:hypothetical protein